VDSRLKTDNDDMDIENPGASFSYDISLLTALPPELQQLVLLRAGSYENPISTKMLGRVSQTSRGLNGLFNDLREELKPKTLLQAVLYGNEDKANKMLDANPELLFVKSTAIDCLGRHVTCSPYQAALRDRDTDMLKMMEEYITDLDLAALQRTEQYPEGIEEQSVFNFKTILEAIKASDDLDAQLALNKHDNDSPLCKALNTFRRQFKVHVMNEKNFNPQHLLRAFQLYDEQFDNFRISEQRDLFWRQVIGYVQRFLPACDRQTFAQGIYFLVEESEPLKRSFDFHDGNGSFPVNFDESHSGLGFDYAAYVALIVDGQLLDAGWAASLLSLENLCRTKTSDLQNFMQPRQRLSCGCVIV
jgi:hypothetical protein